MTMFVTRGQEDVQGAVPQDGLRTFVTKVEQHHPYYLGENILKLGFRGDNDVLIINFYHMHLHRTIWFICYSLYYIKFSGSFCVIKARGIVTCCWFKNTYCLEINGCL